MPRKQKTIKVAIVEDVFSELFVLKKRLLGSLTKFDIVYETTDVAEAKRCLPLLKIDIAFIDINLGVTDGFELLRNIKPYFFKVVFTTAYDQYAYQAFKIEALDYLIKPVTSTDINILIQKFYESTHNKVAGIDSTLSLKGGNGGLLIINTQNEILTVDPDTLFYLAAERAYTKFYFNDRIIAASKSTSYYQDMLPKSTFMRIHRSYIINLRFLVEIKKNESKYLAVMSNGIELTISKVLKNELLDRMNRNTNSVEKMPIILEG